MSNTAVIVAVGLQKVLKISQKQIQNQHGQRVSTESGWECLAGWHLYLVYQIYRWIHPESLAADPFPSNM